MTLRVGRDSQGFSLFELILVLILLGISSLLVIPNVARGMRDQEVRRAALELAAVARELRSQALREGLPQALVLMVAESRYSLGSRREIQLPGDVKFVAISGGEPLEGASRRFVFFPNGSALPGTVKLARSETSPAYAIRFEPLTGRVEVLRGNES